MPSWKRLFIEEQAKDYFIKLNVFITSEITAGKTIFPPEDKRYSAFDLCPFEQVKVVVIGQDPYHDFAQAHGLSFSVPKGVDIPPSLRNILTELKAD